MKRTEKPNIHLRLQSGEAPRVLHGQNGLGETGYRTSNRGIGGNSRAAQ